MTEKTLADLAEEIRKNPDPRTLREGALKTLIARYSGNGTALATVIDTPVVRSALLDKNPSEEDVEISIYNLLDAMHDRDETISEPTKKEAREWARDYTTKMQGGSRRRNQISKKFTRCLKSVQKTRKVPVSFAICTTSVLYPRGKTIKRYRKGRLTTQKRKQR